jgi:hypothetical protein
MSFEDPAPATPRFRRLPMVLIGADMQAETHNPRVSQYRSVRAVALQAQEGRDAVLPIRNVFFSRFGSRSFEQCLVLLLRLALHVVGPRLLRRDSGASNQQGQQPDLRAKPTSRSSRTPTRLLAREQSNITFPPSCIGSCASDWDCLLANGPSQRDERTTVRRRDAKKRPGSRPRHRPS